MQQTYKDDDGKTLLPVSLELLERYNNNLKWVKIMLQIISILLVFILTALVLIILRGDVWVWIKGAVLK